MPESCNEYPDATAWRRLLALIYDALIVVAILIFAGAIGLGVAVALYGEQAVTDGGVLNENPVYFAWLLFCWFYYYFYCWSKTGQTLAMKTWRMQLITLDESPIEMHQALIRFFTGFLGLGNIIALLPSRWTLHDALSKTRVVVLPKQAKRDEV